jgi:hypothetical protein
MDSSGSDEEQPVITVHAKTIPTRTLINFFHTLSLRSLAPLYHKIDSLRYRLA